MRARGCIWERDPGLRMGRRRSADGDPWRPPRAHGPWRVAGRTETPTVPALSWTPGPAPARLLPGPLPGPSPPCLRPRLLRGVPTGSVRVLRLLSLGVSARPSLPTGLSHGSAALAPTALTVFLARTLFPSGARAPLSLPAPPEHRLVREPPALTSPRCWPPQHPLLLDALVYISAHS